LIIYIEALEGLSNVIFYLRTEFYFNAGLSLQEESIIKAQKKRVNQKALVLSEFDSGFKGIALSERAKPQKSTPKSHVKKRKKPFKKS